MIKCINCAFYLKNGKRHTCEKVKNKIIFGALIEPFKEYCSDFKSKDVSAVIRGRK